MSPEIASKVVRSAAADQAARAGGGPHAAGMRLLALLAEGYSYLSAAGQLEVSVNTVRNYIRSIYEKLQVHTSTEAVSRACAGASSSDSSINTRSCDTGLPRCAQDDSRGGDPMRSIVGVVLLVLAGSATAARSAEPEEQFAALERQWMDALAAKDEPTLQALLAPEFTIVGSGSRRPRI